MAPIRTNRNDPDDAIRADLRRISETLAVQNQVLSNIVQKQEQSAQMSAQQSVQLGVLSTDVAILKSEMPKFQTELNNLTAWKTDALNLFVPRREHEALHHEERIAEMEEWRRTDQSNKVIEQSKKADDQRTFFEWIADHALTVLLFLLTFGLSLFNIISSIFHH